MEQRGQEGERMCSLQQVVGVPSTEEETQKLMGGFGYINVGAENNERGDKSYDVGRTPRKKDLAKSEPPTSTTARPCTTSSSKNVKKSIDRGRELVRRHSAGSEGRGEEGRRDLMDEFESVCEKQWMTDAFWAKVVGMLDYKIGSLTKDFSAALGNVEAKLTATSGRRARRASRSRWQRTTTSTTASSAWRPWR